MKILIENKPLLVVPTRGKPNDAAYDLTAVMEPEICGVKFEIPSENLFAWRKVDYIQYRTGLFISPQDESKLDKVVKFHTQCNARSSVSTKNLMLANGTALIDHDYRGEILLRFKYYFQPQDFIIYPEGGIPRIFGILDKEAIYKKGNKIAQIRAVRNIDVEFEIVDSLDDTTRGIGGFGSTTKV